MLYPNARAQALAEDQFDEGYVAGFRAVRQGGFKTRDRRKPGEWQAGYCQAFWEHTSFLRISVRRYKPSFTAQTTDLDDALSRIHPNRQRVGIPFFTNRSDGA